MRYYMLDGIRGITLISMILYHLVWDIVFIMGENWMWFQSDFGYIWQQSICWIFILLSGFCWSMGKRKLKRGIVVFATGALITFVTIIFMPEQRAVFGILTLLGSSMILMIPLEKILQKVTPIAGLCVSGSLFILLRNINDGYLGFENWNLVTVPAFFYHNIVTAFLGFPEHTFYSVDYFSLFPWIFLFLSGYFLYQIMNHKNKMTLFTYKGNDGLEFLGRHSLVIYLLHQPIIYFTLLVFGLDK